MPDATTHTHPPTPRLDEEAREVLLPDVAPWIPPEPGVESPGGELRRAAVALEVPDRAGVDAEAALAPPGEELPSGAGQVAWEAPPAGPDSEDTLPPRADLGTRQRRALPGKPTPQLDLPLPLLVLTEQARRASSMPERQELASKLNALLAQMAAEGGDRQVADTFHRLLGSGKLEGLVGTEGRTCRAAAVEALLSLGFPYALEVEPEDLEYLRASGQEGPLARIQPLAVLVTGVGTQLFLELTRSGGPDGLVTIQVGLSALAMMALWLAPPRTPVYRLGLGLLALVSVLGLLLPLVAGGPPGALLGVAGLVAVFLAALRES
ncbi:hypothetical protein LXT23_16585 [Pyxidicoccus sp. QH1ED-7-1]|nr:hypothetical protein [Pyxidicoccus xibeiensis]